jgi:hypothetical protein
LRERREGRKVERVERVEGPVACMNGFCKLEMEGMFVMTRIEATWRGRVYPTKWTLGERARILSGEILLVMLEDKSGFL